jgi:hypothetical protein
MKKSDAWVVLRLDRDVVGINDYLAVKGVYDSEDDAQSAIQSLSEESNYLVIRSRHYLEDNKTDDTKNNHSGKVQGLKVQSPSRNTSDHEIYKQFHAIQGLWNQIPPLNRQRNIFPLLSELTELAVAKATGASILHDPSLLADLKLPNGELIEVKTIILDPDRRKSPNIQFRANLNFNYLAVVVFDPDLNIEIARMIPVEVVRLHARPASHVDGRQIQINLRVTQLFLDYPGSQDINFANYSLKAG